MLGEHSHVLILECKGETLSDSAENLMRQIAERDESAMHSFYQAHQTIVYSFALKRLGDPANAREILNEVMLDVWKKAERYVDQGKLKSWLLSVTHNKIVDKIRSESRHNSSDIDDFDFESNEESMVAAMERADDAGSVRHCIGTLSDNHRTVVHLAFFQGHSYGEISQIVDCPENTVTTRMYHAKKLLEKCLSEIDMQGN